MTTTLETLLGEKLVEHNKSDRNQLNEISTNELNGKFVGLYLSAHSCEPCQKFTFQLIKVFKDMYDEIKTKFDIVFISWDKNQEDFDKYYKEMPWKALPFPDPDRCDKFYEKFQADGIPCLIILSPSLEIINSNGVDEIYTAPEEALRRWCEGKRLFWSRVPRKDEYVWEESQCEGCYLRPLLGLRYGCANSNCEINYCEKCLSKSKHEHPIIEYLIPKEKYSLEKLFQSIPYLIQSNKEEKIETKTILENNYKFIGFYFSAHWCQPCREFTPKFVKLYKEIQEISQSFQIIFLSSDEDEHSFNNYRSEMPWLAAPLNSGEILNTYFQKSGIPALVIVKADGQILSLQGDEDLTHFGIEAFKTWEKGEKLARPSPDQYIWTGYNCDQCNTSPIIGQMYHCTVCENYDLCSTCQKKGHQHPLELTPQPDDDDEQ